MLGVRSCPPRFVIIFRTASFKHLAFSRAFRICSVPFPPRNRSYRSYTPLGLNYTIAGVRSFSALSSRFVCPFFSHRHHLPRRTLAAHGFPALWVEYRNPVSSGNNLPFPALVFYRCCCGQVPSLAPRSYETRRRAPSYFPSAFLFVLPPSTWPPL